MNSIHFGLFDSESYWNDTNLAVLPKYNNTAAKQITYCMDELLCFFAEPCDILLTNMKFNDVLFQYLKSLGLDFESLVLQNGITTDLDNSYINNVKKRKNLLELNYEPYAMVFKNLVSSKLPSFDTTKLVNSKEYSTNVNHEFGYHHGSVVESLSDFFSLAYTKENKFIIKEYYGVSGKGSIIIENKKMLANIANFLEKQIIQGKKIGLVIETYLNKKIDFSSHVYLSRNGEYELISIEILINNHQTAYLGSVKPNKKFLDFIEQGGYFAEIEKYIKKLHIDGYSGYINFDSMITQDNRILPVIEINARKSMGLIHHYAEKRLGIENKSYMTFIDIKVPKTTNFEIILSELDKAQVLFKPNSISGVIPISANTIFANRDLGDTQYSKGRLYLLIVDTNGFEQEKIRFALKTVLENMNIVVY